MKPLASSNPDIDINTGSGSDRRRKAIINRAVRDQSLFEKLMRTFRGHFKTLVVDLQRELQAVVETHLGCIESTFNILRSDNAAEECERNPEFRSRVEAKVVEVKEESRMIQSIVSS